MHLKWDWSQYKEMDRSGKDKKLEFQIVRRRRNEEGGKLADRVQKNHDSVNPPPD